MGNPGSRNPKSDLSALIEIQSSPSDDRTTRIDREALKKAQKAASEIIQNEKQAQLSQAFAERSAVRRWQSRALKFFFVLLILLLPAVSVYNLGRGDIALGGQRALFIVRNWFSPLPLLEDLSPSAYDELRAATQVDLEKKGASLAFAFSEQSDPARPVLYIASNLPDGARLDVYFHGHPGTLASERRYDSKFEAVITRNFAKADPITSRSIPMLPAGDYSVTLVEARNQPETIQRYILMLREPSGEAPAHVPGDRRLVSTKTLFLGGKKDQKYFDDLRIFQEKLKTAALNELKSLGDLLGVIEEKAAILGTFFQLQPILQAPPRKLPAKARKAKQAEWLATNDKWVKSDGDFRDLVQAFTNESKTKTRYFPSFFKEIETSSQGVFQIFADMQASALKQSVAKPPEEVLSKTKNQLSEIRSRIEAQTKKLDSSDISIEGEETP